MAFENESKEFTRIMSCRTSYHVIKNCLFVVPTLIQILSHISVTTVYLLNCPLHFPFYCVVWRYTPYTPLNRNVYDEAFCKNKKR